MTGDDEGDLVHIGAVAERTGLSLRTLRHYDDVGLVQPSGRTQGGFRLYSGSDVNRLLLIRRMKPLGFTLEEMATLLKAVESPTDGLEASAAEELLAAARSTREQLLTRLTMADEFIDLLATRLGATQEQRRE